jgi:Transposase DDE domain
MAQSARRPPVSQDTLRRVQEQAKSLRSSEAIPYETLLNGQMVEIALAEEQIEFRDRIFTPLVTLWTFLNQVLSPDHSCREAVSKLIAFLVSQGEHPCSPDTSSYCDARKRLPVSFLARLVRAIGALLEPKAQPDWRWKDRAVHLIDGSTVSMPDTPENQAAYPQPRTQKPGLGFPLARIVAIISFTTGAIGPYKGKDTGETSLFRTLVHRLKRGDVVLGDRYFASFFGIAQLVERGIDGVFRMHQLRKVDFRRGRSLGVEDHRVLWRKPARPDWMDEATYASIPDEMWVRELRIRVTEPGYRVSELVLVTTLLDSIEYPKDEIAQLYMSRWNVELDLRSIKVVMQMDILRCKKPELVEKEIWVHLLAYNIIRRLMMTAGTVHDVPPREISFKGTLQALGAFGDRMEMATPAARQTLWDEMLAVIAHHRVGDRPGRVEPRAIKRRPKPHPLLKLPRDQARKQLLKTA